MLWIWVFVRFRKKMDMDTATHLKGRRSVMSSTEISLPYQGHMINIWEEYAIKQMRQRTKLTMSRPKTGCMGSLFLEARRWRWWSTTVGSNRGRPRVSVPATSERYMCKYDFSPDFVQLLKRFQVQVAMYRIRSARPPFLSSASKVCHYATDKPAKPRHIITELKGISIRQSHIFVLQSSFPNITRVFIRTYSQFKWASGTSASA